MKNTCLYLLGAILLFGNLYIPAQQQSNQNIWFAATLVCINKNQDDRQMAYQISMNFLKDRFRFFDEAHHRKLVEDFYRRNPGVNADDFHKRLQDMKFQTRLLVIVKSKLTLEPDEEFPIFYHIAEVSISVLDNQGSSEIYSQQSASSGKTFVPLPDNDWKHWKEESNWTNNKESRNLALQRAIQKAVPKTFEDIAELSSKIIEEKVGIIAADFFPEHLKKLDAILEELQHNGEIRVVAPEPTERYLTRKVIFPKRDGKPLHTQFSFHHLLREACEAESLRVNISSDIGKIFLSLK